MNRPWTALLALLLTLTACGIGSGDGNVLMLDLDGPAPLHAEQHGGSPQMMVLLPADGDGRSVRATLQVGTQSRKAVRYGHAGDPGRWYVLMFRCQGVPQGEPVSVRSVLYGPGDAVLADRTVQVRFDTCP